VEAHWGTWMGVTAIILSMIVNALATGLIVYRILKVYREVKPTLTLGEQPLGNSGGVNLKYRNVLSIIIESGMTLFCVQLVRVVLIVYFEVTGSGVSLNALQIIIGIQEILNVSIYYYYNISHCFLITWVCLGYNTYHHLSAGLNGIVFLQRGIHDRLHRR
jgi:hypothetical protein